MTDGTDLPDNKTVSKANNSLAKVRGVWNRMTTKQKIIATGAFALIITAVAVLLFTSPARRGPLQQLRWAVNAGDCLDAALQLYTHSEWETGLDLRAACEASEERKSDYAPRFDRIAGTREKFASLIGDWTPPWPAPDSTVPADGPLPIEARARMDKLSAFIAESPDDESAELAAAAKAALLFYLARFDECASFLADNPLNNTLPEYAALLRVMALEKSGAHNDAIDAADKDLSKFPDSLAAVDIALWKARALKSKGDLQAAMYAAVKASEFESAPPTARGRALIFAANIATAQGNLPERTRLLVSIAENYPKIDADHFLDEEFDEKKDNPTVRQSLSLARYFLEKGRGYPVRRFLTPVKSLIGQDGLLLLARAELLRDNRKEAAKILDQLGGAGTPEDVRADACILRAKLFIKTGEYPKAVARAGACAQNFPKTEPDALEIIARAYAIKGSDDLRLKTLMRLTEKYPGRDGNDIALLEIGRLYLTAGKKDAAKGIYQALVDQFPDSQNGAESMFWLGRLDYEAGDNAAAAELFNKVQEKYPYSYFNFRAGQYLAQMDMPDNSFAAAPVSLQDMLPESNDHLRAAHSLRRLRLFDAAAAEYNAAAADAPDDAAIGLSRIAFESGDVMAAVKTLEIRILESSAFYDRAVTQPSVSEILYPIHYTDLLAVEGAKYDIDPVWLLSIIRQESRFNPLARSSSNAMGLMQIIPSTAQWIADKLNYGRIKSADMYTPELNIKFGVWYFNHLLNKFDGEYALAIAAYNGGPGNVGRWIGRSDPKDIDLFIERIPRDETRDYTKKVLHNYFVYSKLSQSKQPVVGK